MTAKRRKPTKATQKTKAPGKAKQPAKPGAHKNPDFDQITQAAGDKKIVLHIGCGAYNPQKLHENYRGEDWFELRYDIDVDVKPHIVGDMRDMSVIPDKAVDAVWSSHNLEHLYAHDVPVALKEIYRVIKPRGHFLVTMPDLETVATYVAHGKLEEPIYDSPAGPISAIDILYGFRASMARGNLYMAHKSGFTANSLAMHLRNVGFCNMKVLRKWVDLWGIAYKFEADDPERTEKIELIVDKENKQMRLPKPIPVNRAQHPGQFAPNMRTDELDIPPARWEPLGLSDAK